MPLARVEPPEDVVLYHVFPPNCVYFCSSLSYKTGRIVASETCQHTSKMIATHPSRKESWNMLSAESGFFSQVTGKHLRIHCIGIQFIAARVWEQAFIVATGSSQSSQIESPHRKITSKPALPKKPCTYSVRVSQVYLHQTPTFSVISSLHPPSPPSPPRPGPGLHPWPWRPTAPLGGAQGAAAAPTPGVGMTAGRDSAAPGDSPAAAGPPAAAPSAPCEGPAWKRVKDRGRIMFFLVVFLGQQCWLIDLRLRKDEISCFSAVFFWNWDRDTMQCCNMLQRSMDCCHRSFPKALECTACQPLSPRSAIVARTSPEHVKIKLIGFGQFW